MSKKNSAAWQALTAHKNHIADTKISEMFAADGNRFSKFSLQHQDLLFDYSKQQITQDTVKLLCDLAVEANVQPAISDLFNGSIVNQTEQRPALHTELRNPATNKPEIMAVLEQMTAFVSKMQASNYTDVIVLGIGGSDLGPRLVCEALAPFKTSALNIHFVANVDSDTLTPLLRSLDPSTTACIINSKTFTTIETLANASIVKSWLGSNAAASTWAVTAHVKNATAFGIKSDHIFAFWDWVGGRYSVWSAVGLPIALSLGMDNFRRVLSGAHAMDQHFYTTEFSKNIPVMQALIGIWNINFLNYNTLAIQPYADGLQLLPDYLQQLEMESNGKSAENSGVFVDYQTAPVIWGGVGCNGQHAYMQMLHQGTQVVPVDFLVARRSHNEPQDLQRLLIASCLGQSQALMTGRKDPLYYKVCPGNRPSSTIMFDTITPEIIGALIAMYEHKVFVQGTIWQIQPFDQWGVQLGKDLITDVLELLRGGDLDKVDNSTAGLVRSVLAR
jgi:glucose-6-phosphate isomerase